MESLNFNSQERALHQLKQMQDNAKENCMVSFRLLHSHLKVLSNNDLKGTCIEGGFERAFMALFDQDVQTFTGSMLLNLNQLEQQLDKEEFQETGSMDALEVNERQMQSKEGKVDSSKALDASLVVTECSGTKLDKQDTSSSLGNYITHVVDADIRPVNDQVSFAEVQLTAQHNVLANEQQHYVQSKPSYDTHLLEKVDRNITPDLTKCVTWEERLTRMLKNVKFHEKVFANVALKNEIRKLKGNSVDTKFAKPSILGKPILQPPKNQSVVRQPNAFKSKRPNFLKPRFASQVDVNIVLSNPATPQYLPKVRESVFAKPHHVIAPGSSRNSSKESYGSNDMAHNYYL
ncbi:hypothetical protein Tco_0680928 [Tanacetum coccineum]|uniref:Uncharacterized protein n=1 Tax=Tanacetum coccineum TaxID=301880 RepID=A0ABQ4XLV6_9ASTR